MPSHKRLLEILDYCPDTGIFRWKIQIGKGRVGNIAGTMVDARGYCRIGFDGGKWQSHRLAWFYVHGIDPESLSIDHINGNPSDNRINNLRLATATQNQCNSKTSVKNRSGAKGVCWNKASEHWEVRVTINRRRFHMGGFLEFKEAVAAAKSTRERIHKEFARHS